MTSGRSTTSLYARVRLWQHGHPVARVLVESEVARERLDAARAWLEARGRTTGIGQSSDIASIDDFGSMQATFSSKARKRLPAADPAAVSALRDEFYRLCKQHQARGGRLVYRTGALVALGQAPGRTA